MLYKEKQKDINFGLKEEDKIRHILEKYFNVELIKPSNKYKSYDLKGGNLRIEIKSRRISSTKYPTTLLCESKLNYYHKIKGKKRYIVVFNFVDGMKYIEIDDDIANKKRKDVYISRGEIVKNIEIEIERLNRIEME